MGNIVFEKYKGIAKITINRPDKLNALNFDTLSELKKIIELSYTDDEIRGVIITGSGEKAFVAGADINEIATMNAADALAISKNGQAIFALIENSPKPTIAAVNGFALGGGCELAIACHMRVAAENAIFGQPEVNLGIIPGYGGTQRLTQLIGKAKAIELICTADYIKADEALQLGLVNYVLPQDQIIHKSEEILFKIFSKPRKATSLVIASVNAVYNIEVNGYETEAQSFSDCTNSGDFNEGTQAFLEKRKPNFE
jgi:enoyl-CoA hydratase